MGELSTKSGERAFLNYIYGRKEKLVMDKESMSLMSDFYEFKALGSYINAGLHTREAEFDLFLRKLPSDCGYAVFAGLEQVCDYLQSLFYDDSVLGFLKSTGEFDRGFFDYLKNFRFSGTLKSVPEGSVVFPGEPILTVRAPLAEAVLIETAILQIVNYQSLVATKTSRMVSAARGLPIIEMGARRANSRDAALYGARAAYIGGSASTTCALAGNNYNIPCAAIMPHSFVQSFDGEYEAFDKWVSHSYGPIVLTLDTYDTLSSGTDNAIGALLRLLKSRSVSTAVRIDSGDIAYLAARVRQKLDRAGLEECKIMASGELNENKIRTLLNSGAPVDCFGVGEALISDTATLGGVYKLAAIEEDGVMKPQIKLGESFRRVTLPGSKKLLRFYDRRMGRAIVDEVCLEDERLPRERHTVFDPHSTFKTKELVNFEVREMLEPVIVMGERVLPPQNLCDIRTYCARELETLCSDVRRLDNPADYYVDLSEKLWTLRRRMTGAKRSAFFLR